MTQSKPCGANKSHLYVSDPNDPIRAILNLYMKHEQGADGADGQISAILLGKGWAEKKADASDERRHPPLEPR